MSSEPDSQLVEPFDYMSMPLPFMLEMGRAETIEQLMQVVARWVGEIIKSARCSIAVLEDDEKGVEQAKLRFYVLSGRSAIKVGHRLPVAGSIQGRAILSRKPLFVPDLRDVSGIEAPMLLNSGLRSCVCCPLISGDRCYGGLNVAHENTDHYTPFDIQQLEAIGGWVAMHLRMAKQLEQLNSHARTDYLTGALNRLAFTDISETLFEQWRQDSTVFSLAALDLDNFKRTNDRFGHAAGDAVLIEVSRRIRARIRGADIFARIGGEEFAILFVGADLEQASTTAEDVRQLISEEPIGFDDFSLPATISMGVSSPIDQDSGFHHLFSRADKLLYQAKANGRNRVIVDTAYAA